MSWAILKEYGTGYKLEQKTMPTKRSIKKMATHCLISQRMRLVSSRAFFTCQNQPSSWFFWDSIEKVHKILFPRAVKYLIKLSSYAVQKVVIVILERPYLIELFFGNWIVVNRNRLEVSPEWTQPAVVAANSSQQGIFCTWLLVDVIDYVFFSPYARKHGSPESLSFRQIILQARSHKYESL